MEKNDKNIRVVQESSRQKKQAPKNSASKNSASKNSAFKTQRVKKSASIVNWRITIYLLISFKICHMLSRLYNSENWNFELYRKIEMIFANV